MEKGAGRDKIRCKIKEQISKQERKGVKEKRLKRLKEGMEKGLDEIKKMC